MYTVCNVPVEEKYLWSWCALDKVNLMGMCLPCRSPLGGKAWAAHQRWPQNSSGHQFQDTRQSSNFPVPTNWDGVFILNDLGLSKSWPACHCKGKIYRESLSFQSRQRALLFCLHFGIILDSSTIWGCHAEKNTVARIFFADNVLAFTWNLDRAVFLLACDHTLQRHNHSEVQTFCRLFLNNWETRRFDLGPIFEPMCWCKMHSKHSIGHISAITRLIHNNHGNIVITSPIFCCSGLVLQQSKDISVPNQDRTWFLSASELRWAKQQQNSTSSLHKAV